MGRDAGAKPLAGGLAHPARTFSEAISQMPDDWAKRRLIFEGPTTPGRSAARNAAITIAAELRLSGVSSEDVLAYLTSVHHLFETGNTKGRVV